MKQLKKTLALFLVMLTIFTTCSVVMPVLASYEIVTAGNVTSGNAPETETELTEEPEILSEIIEKREENTKHFLMSDGTFMVAQYPTAVHYQNDSEEWIEYNNTVKETEASMEQVELFGTDKLYSTSNLLENIVFAEKSNSNTLVSYEAKDHPISFNYHSAKKSKIKIIKNETELTGNNAFLALPDITQEVLYENVFYGVDLQYIVSPDKIKENIVIKNKSAQNSFTVNYNIGELTAEVVDDKTINLMAGDKVVYTISAPFMYDANGEKSENITLTVEKNHNGKLTANITADSQWLQAENRAYPVAIDPSIQTETDRYSIDSVMISKLCGNTNYSTQSEMVVGYEGNNYGQCRVLVKFVLPALNKGDIIVDAQLNIYNTELDYYYSSTADMQVDAHMLTGSWSLTGVTWNNQPSYDSVVSDYNIFKNGTATKWRTFNVTKMVKEWYDTPANNFGILLKSSTEVADKNINGVKAKLYSEKYNSVQNAYPSLTLTYRNNKGLEDYWSYTTLSAGTAGTAYINDYTGNLVFIHGDVATTGELMPVSLEHVYNGYMAGLNSGKYPHSGRGNKLSMQQTLKSSSYYGLSGVSLEKFPYAYEDGDGTVHYFYKETKDGVTKYKDEDGLNLELTFDEASSDKRYTVTDKSGGKMHFNYLGNLKYIENAEGISAVLSYKPLENYEGDTVYYLNKITDGAGHQISLTYDNGEGNSSQLSQITGPDGKSISYGTSGGKITTITYPDGTKSRYTYDDDGALLTAKSSDGYMLTFTYSTDGAKRVTSVTESNGTTTGQKIVFNRDKLGQTKIETAGNDAVFGGDDDLITTYQFDNFGRTVSTKMKLRSGTSLGAEKYDYTTGSRADGTDIGKRNRISSSAAMGKNINNILANHSFESSGGWADLYWMNSAYTGTGSAVYSTAQKYMGAKSIAVTVSENGATTNGGFCMYQDADDYVSSTSSDTYTLSGYVKTSGVKAGTGAERGGACLGVKIVDSESNVSRYYSEMLTGTTDTDIDNGWQRIHVTFTVPKGASLRVAPMLYNATGTAYFDCLQLEKNSTVNSYNLLENASFEKGADSWTAYNCDSGDAVSTARYNTGSHSYKLVGTSGTDKYIRQTVYVSGSEKDTYILSGYARAYAVPLDMEAGRRMDITVKINYSDDTYVYKKPTLFNGEVAGMWQYASGIFTLSDDDKNTTKTPESIVVYCGYRKQANTCYFDDISLVKEPAPTYSYDKDGNLVSATENAEKTSALDYDGNNNLTSFTDERGGIYEYKYAETGNPHRLLTAKSKETGITYAYSYNASGIAYRQDVKDKDGKNIIRTGNTYTAESGGINQHAYVATSRDQHGYTTTYDYNLQSGLLNSVTDPNGNVTEYDYDENTKLLKKVKAGNNTVEYTYNDAGTRLSSIKHNGFNYNFVYDAFGNVTQTKVEGKALMTNEYQPNNGNLIKSTYGNGTVKTYEYNNYGQTTRVNIDGQKAYYWRYNNSGYPYMHTDYVSDRVYYYTYDSLGRIIRQFEKTYGADEYRFASQYTYDLSNNLKKEINVADGKYVSTKNTYDKENRPTKTTLNDNVNFQYAYDGLGRLSTVTMNNSSTKPIKTEYTFYDSNRENSSNSVTYTTTQIKTETLGDKEEAKNRTYEYTYGKRGNITKITEKVGSGTATQKVSYTYDALGQLKRENNVDLNKTIVYNYDNGGNITSKVEYPYTTGALGTATNTITYGYINQDGYWGDKLRSITVGETTQSFTYDSIGNPLTYRDGMTFTWQGRQMATANINGTAISYKYDADGLRTEKTVGTTLHEYEYSGGRLYYEKRGNLKFYYRYNALGNLASITYIGADNKITTIYAIANSRGDVEELRAVDGSLIARYVYDSWGKTDKIIDGNGAVIASDTQDVGQQIALQNPIRYRGYYWDSETGLYYLQSRYYDPVVGRFVSADSLVDTSDVLGFNMYAYCGNNPVMREDGGGNFWDVVFDVVSIAYSTYEVIKNPKSVRNWAALAADVVSAVIPGVTGGGAAVKAIAKYGDDVLDLAKAGDRVYDSYKTADKVRDTYRATDKINDTRKASSRLSGGVCFVAGTQIVTENRKENIEDIKVGDTVWATNLETGETELKKVVQTFVNETSELVHIYVNGEEIITTPEHPFYVSNYGWIGAIELRAGDKLVLVNGEFAVIENVQHEILEQPIKVYNFEVEDFHTYYVGDTGVLVHNACSITNTLPQNGIKVDSSDALDMAEEYLGAGYIEKELGRFVSNDGVRQVRMLDSDLTPINNHAGAPHLNFDILSPKYKSVHVYIFD